MKLHALGAAAAMCCCVSCGTVQVISFDQLRPAAISFPGQVRNVAVVDNTPPAAKPKRDAVTLGTIEGNGKEAAEGLASALADSKYFSQVMICDSALRPAGIPAETVRALPVADVDYLAGALEADMLFSLDRVRIQTQEKEVFFPGVAVGWPVLGVKVTPVLSVYLPSRGKPVQVVAETDSLELNVDEIVSEKQVIDEAVALSVRSLVGRLVPFWETTDRIYFDGGCAEMRDGGVCVRENDWEGAREQWQALYDRCKSRRLKLRSSFNIALAYEMEGDLAQAGKWLEESKSWLSEGSEDRHAIAYYEGQLEERRQDLPRLHTQMSRFGNKFGQDSLPE